MDYIDLGEPAKAAPLFRAALDYWRQRKDWRTVTDSPLSKQAINALLWSRQYDEAIKLAGELVSEVPADDRGAMRETIGATIRQEADRLHTAEIRDYKNALSLIDKALTMKPPLLERQLEELRSIRRDIEERLAEQGNGGDVPVDDIRARQARPTSRSPLYRNLADRSAFS